MGSPLAYVRLLLRFLRCNEGVIADYIDFVGFGATGTQRDFKEPFIKEDPSTQRGIRSDDLEY